MSSAISPPIEYLKSALSVNTALGCSLGCGYCLVGEIARKSPKRISTPERVVAELLENRFFIPNVTPLAINNKTDPFLGFVKEDSFEILGLLQKEGLSNPRLIISKLALSNRDLAYMEELNEPVFFITSYSHLRYPIEKSNSENQLTSLRALENRERVRSLHYWRPVIRGLNDSPESLARVLENVVGGCDGSIISGLRITPGILERMTAYGADLRDWEGDLNHKHLPEDIQERIFEFRDQNFPGYPLYRHTSCGVSHLKGVSDYGFNFLKGSPHCVSSSGCSNACSLRTVPSESEVVSYLDKLGLERSFFIREDSLYIEGDITQEEKSSLTHSLKYPVRASRVSKSLSEKMITEENEIK